MSFVVKTHCHFKAARQNTIMRKKLALFIRAHHHDMGPPYMQKKRLDRIRRALSKLNRCKRMSASELDELEVMNRHFSRLEYGELSSCKKLSAAASAARSLAPKQSHRQAVYMVVIRESEGLYFERMSWYARFFKWLKLVSLVVSIIYGILSIMTLLS